MKVDLEERGGVSVLVLSGNLTSGDCDKLRESVDTLLAAGRTDILLGFEDVEYIDSAGIGELVASFRTTKRFGGVLKILRPGQKVQDSLELTRLLPVFEVFEDEAEALASFTVAAE